MATLLMATLLDVRGPVVVMPLLLLLSAVPVSAFVVAWKITPPTAVVPHEKDGTGAKIPPMAWLLAIMAVGFGLSEGTATDCPRCTSLRSPRSTPPPAPSA
jgi:hypothetical protein